MIFSFFLLLRSQYVLSPVEEQWESQVGAQMAADTDVCSQVSTRCTLRGELIQLVRGGHSIACFISNPWQEQATLLSSFLAKARPMNEIHWTRNKAVQTIRTSPPGFLGTIIFEVAPAVDGGLGVITVSLCVFFWHAGLLLFSYVFALSGPDRFLGGVSWEEICSVIQPGLSRSECCTKAECGDCRGSLWQKTIGGIPAVSEPHNRDV